MAIPVNFFNGVGIASTQEHGLAMTVKDPLTIIISLFHGAASLQEVSAGGWLFFKDQSIRKEVADFFLQSEVRFACLANERLR